MTANRRLTRWDHFRAWIGWPRGDKGAVTYYGPESVSSNTMFRWLDNGVSATGICVNENIALNLPVVYACINRIANPLAGVPVKVVKQNDRGRMVTVTDHPLSEMLAIRPNEFMSSRSLRKTVQAHCLLWGNGFVEIERRGNGEVAGLYPWLPWDTQIKIEDNRLVYESKINGSTVKRQDSEILHLMDVSTDGYQGVSPIMRAGASAVGLAVAAETFGSKFFQNDARGGGFLMHPAKLSENARQNIQQSMQAEAGLKNAHKIKILEEGMKFVDTQIPPEAAQFLGTRQFQIAEIARIYDVPLIMLQEQESTTAWGTGIEQLMIGFVRQTVMPWAVAWEQEMNFKLLTQKERQQGVQIKFNLNGLLRGDSQARAQFYQALWQMGAVSANWILAKEDEELDLGTDGDETFVPVNYQPLKFAVEEPPEPVAPGGFGAPDGDAPAEDDAE